MGALAWLSACPSPPVDITLCPSRAADIFWPKLVQGTPHLQIYRTHPPDPAPLSALPLSTVVHVGTGLTSRMIPGVGVAGEPAPLPGPELPGAAGSGEDGVSLRS